MTQTTTPIRYIRQNVFKLNQGDFAKMLDTTQATVSRMETGILGVTDDRKRQIRDLAVSRGVPFDFAWFFEVPTP